MRSMMVLSLLATFPMMQTVFASSQVVSDDRDDTSGWTMIYENDETGKTVNGSLSSLIMAVKKGMDIKVLNEAGNHVEVVNCSELFVLNDPSFPNMVACFSHHTDTDYDVNKGSNVKFKPTFNRYHAVYDSNGEITINSASAENRATTYHYPQKGHFKWFVKVH